MTLTKHLLVAVAIVTALTACSGADERKAKYLDQAKAYYAEGNYDKARLDFQNVLQIDPNHVEARFMLGQLLEKRQNWRGAVGQFQRVIELDPNHVDARIHVGRIYLLGRATEQGMKMAQEALNLAPQNPDALTLRGGAYAQQDEIDKAITDAKAALRVDPGHVDATVLLSTLFVRQKQYNDATKLLENAIVKHADQIALRTLLARIDEQKGDNEKSAKLLKEIVALKPSEFAFRSQLAAFYGRTGNNDAAESVLRDAVKEVPDNIDAKMALVSFLESVRGKDAARTTLQGFMEQAPDIYTFRFGLADLFLLDKDLEHGQQTLQEIVAKDGTGPDGLKARNRLAALLADQGKKDEANSLLAEVLKENPADNDALILHGKIALGGGDAITAIADFRAVLRDQPNSVALLKLLARAHAVNDEHALAVESLQKAVELNGGDTEARMALGNMLAQDTKINAALEQFQAVLKDQPNNIGARESLFKVQLAQKDTAAARNTAARIIEIAPDQGLGYYLAGLAVQQDKKFTAAAKQFELALQKAPDAVEPLSALVKVDLAMKQPAKAAQRLEEVLAKNPKHFAARNLLGEVFMVQNQPEAAAKAFRKVIELNPKLVAPYRNLATLAYSRKDTDGAIKIYQQGIEATDSAPALTASLASLYESRGEYDNAIAQYETILTKTPDSDSAANNLAILLATYKGDAASLKRAKSLVDRFAGSENPAYQDTVGWVYYKLGEIDAALLALDQATQNAPGSALLRYHLGMAQFTKGEAEQARANLEKAVNSEDKFYGAEEAKATLQKLAGL